MSVNQILRRLGQVGRGAVLSALLAGTAHADTVTYTYDALGRLKTATYASGVQIAYAYDPAGNRTQYVVSTSDGMPDEFDLGADVSSATAGAWYPSSVVTVSGLAATAPVGVTNGQYRINGGSWTSTPGTVSNGQTLQVQVKASAAAGASTIATLSVGGVTDTFKITTAP